ncbi:MAG: hypothetical protein RMX35_06255 [Nostoc sp. DcaGUA01]|nr:hypothetical protein [Nostoc sp. DcaGUA01]
MSNDKPLRVYALFLRFSVRRSLLGMCEVRSHSLLHNRRSLCF